MSDPWRSQTRCGIVGDRAATDEADSESTWKRNDRSTDRISWMSSRIMPMSERQSRTELKCARTA